MAGGGAGRAGITAATFEASAGAAKRSSVTRAPLMAETAITVPTTVMVAKVARQPVGRVGVSE
jgi:hypothetical protein